MQDVEKGEVGERRMQDTVVGGEQREVAGVVGVPHVRVRRVPEHAKVARGCPVNRERR